MSTSHFIIDWRTASKLLNKQTPPEGTAFGYKSNRISTSRYMIYWNGVVERREHDFACEHGRPPKNTPKITTYAHKPLRITTLHFMIDCDEVAGNITITSNFTTFENKSLRMST